MTASSPVLFQSPPALSPMTHEHYRSFSHASIASASRSSTRDASDRSTQSLPRSPSGGSNPSDAGASDTPVSAQNRQQGSADNGTGHLSDLSNPPTSANLINLKHSQGSGPLAAASNLPSSVIGHKGIRDQADLHRSSTIDLQSPPVLIDANATQLVLPLPLALQHPPSRQGHGDDGQFDHFMSLLEQPAALPVSPFIPVARPAILRRALSDQDATVHTKPPGLYRSLSTSAELNQSPKRGSIPTDYNTTPDKKLDAYKDSDHSVKSSELSTRPLDMTMPVYSDTDVHDNNDGEPDASHIVPYTALSEHASTPTNVQSSDVGEICGIVGENGLVDEGDVLPNVEFSMDVTFDDEGLNTLERIFLLSKSEYPFHRAYVARVLGDLLKDVDPCESVEYVLPLLSGFSVDDDESVKEAFSSELHRILWYFYSTCRLVEEDTAVIGNLEYEPKRETMTVTSDGLQVVPKPSAAEVSAIPDVMNLRRSSLVSVGDQSSTSSSLTQPPSSTFSPAIEEGNTPNSTVSDASQGTAFSPGAMINLYADEGGSERGWTKDLGPLIDRPTIAIDFFTPLLGSLLLNENPGISDSVRVGIVNLMGRLRGKGELIAGIWGPNIGNSEPDERRTFVSQNGPHTHDLRPFTTESRMIVETELLRSIVIGMGKLSTDMPDSLFLVNPEDGQTAPDVHADEYGEDHLGDASLSSEAEAFKYQLIQEATTGRATSVNLIGAVCEFYTGEEAVERGFIDEVLRSADGDVPVRAEAAVALSFLAKIAPVEYVYKMVS